MLLVGQYGRRSQACGSSQKQQPRYTYLRFDRLFSSLKSGRSEFGIYPGGAGVVRDPTGLILD